MEYRVVLADSARADAESLYQWVIQKAPLRGPEWFDKPLFRVIPKVIPSKESRCVLVVHREHKIWQQMMERLGPTYDFAFDRPIFVTNDV
jgi:hypothetical protein